MISDCYRELRGSLVSQLWYPSSCSQEEKQHRSHRLYTAGSVPLQGLVATSLALDRTQRPIGTSFYDQTQVWQEYEDRKQKRPGWGLLVSWGQRLQESSRQEKETKNNPEREGLERGTGKWEGGGGAARVGKQ